MQQESNSSSRTINGGGQITMKQMTSSITDLISQPPYSSIFFHSSHSPSSLNSHSLTSPTTIPTTTSTTTTSTNTTATSAAISSLSRLMTEHHKLLNRHAVCLSQLHKTFKEAETLRQENTNLRIANRELSNQLDLLIQASLQSRYQYQITPFDQFGEKKRESSGSSSGGGGGWEEGFAGESPTSVIENDSSGDSGGAGIERVTLPKSISVRSNGFLKMMTQAGSGPSGSSSADQVHGPTRIRAPSPNSGPQKVYVRGGSRKNGPIELEVYNQGMFKTELCNKWQESGSCPYGDHCQFAHGIGELRPVIRHPRYKTEVCRMVLAGDPCPYGHRCHFRHALTEQEKLMIPLRLD